MGMMCKKCTSMCGVLLLLVGLGFLLRDLDVWPFWNLSWWTVAFLLMGCVKLAKTKCEDCAKMCKKK